METDVSTRCKRQCFSADHLWLDHPRFEILIPGLNRAMEHLPKPKKQDRFVVNQYEFFNDPFFNFYIWSPLNLEYLVTSLSKHFPDHLDFISARRARKSRSAVYSPMITASFTQTAFMKLMRRRLSLKSRFLTLTRPIRCLLQMRYVYSRGAYLTIRFCNKIMKSFWQLPLTWSQPKMWCLVLNVFLLFQLLKWGFIRVIAKNELNSGYLFSHLSSYGFSEMMKSLEFWQGFSHQSSWCAGLSLCSSQTKTTRWDASQFGSLRAAGWMKRACVRSAQTDPTLCYHKDSIRSFLCTACVREKLLVAITGQHLDTGGKKDGGLGNLQGHERVSCPLITEQETRKHTVLFLPLGFLKVSRPRRRAAHTQDTSPLLREKHAGSDTHKRPHRLPAFPHLPVSHL